MNIAATSSDHFSLKAWTISFCIHAVAVVCAVGLLRDLPAHVKPPPLRLDFLLVEPETTPASTPGQLTENELLAPELAELEPLSASAPAHPPVMEQPPVTPTSTVQPLDTHPVTTPARQEQIKPMTNAQTTALDAPQPVTQPHPVPSSVSEEARPSVSARIDKPSSLTPNYDPQEQTVTETIDAANSSPPPSTSQTSTPEQADAKDQVAPASTQPAAHTADSGGSSAQETPGSTDVPATAVANHPSIVARTGPSRPDYSWLTNALRRRVESLKTYPRLARIQGWGGRVVVRVTIKDDGSLLDARVVESSGYEILDDEAVLLMQRVCPIRLPHDIGRPYVVVMVPIQYRPEP